MVVPTATGVITSRPVIWAERDGDYSVWCCPFNAPAMAVTGCWPNGLFFATFRLRRNISGSILNTRGEAKLGMGTFSRRDFTKLCHGVLMAGGAVA
jgi:hypothetical protein